MGSKAKAKPKESEKVVKADKKGQQSGVWASTRAEGVADAAAPGTPEKPKRKLGLRSAAPWAARHAAKHAAEARARAAEPPPPGSARATIRTPTGVEEIKVQIIELHNHLEKVKSMRKSLAKSFFDIGAVLRDIQERKLYAAKGFQNFEAFLEREIDLGKSVAMRLTKVAAIFQREAALEYGMERIFDALGRLDSVAETSSSQATTTPLARASSSSMGSAASRSPIVGR